MRLTNDGIKDNGDPLFGTDITGSIAASERADRLRNGWTLGEVTRGKRDVEPEVTAAVGSSAVAEVVVGSTVVAEQSVYEVSLPVQVDFEAARMDDLTVAAEVDQSYISAAA